MYKYRTERCSHGFAMFIPCESCGRKAQAPEPAIPKSPRSRYLAEERRAVAAALDTRPKRAWSPFDVPKSYRDAMRQERARKAGDDA